MADYITREDLHQALRENKQEIVEQVIEQTARLIRASQLELRENLKSFVRDTETRILLEVVSHSERSGLRFRRVEIAEATSAERLAQLEGRMDAVERRLPPA